jgi:23S rRNA pseudouridine1911/1915/1917 synthase
LVLVARDDDAQEMLVNALRLRQIERWYLALVRGTPGTPSGTIDAPIGRHAVRRRQMAVMAGGRPAVTHYRVLASTDEAALLDVRLETGRTHQIRVHLAHLGLPVVGDPTYGGKGDLAKRLELDRPFLHARHLEFPHPDDGRIVRVDDDIPAELAEALERARIPMP